MSEKKAPLEENNWFYEKDGQRIGPISENEIIKLIKTSVVSHQTSVWKQGFPDWIKVEDTQLRSHLDYSAPPPLSGEHINNTIVWVLAFAPLIGLLLEWLLASMIHGGNERAIIIAMNKNKYWYVTLLLNISLAYFDEQRLKAAGYDTDKFKGWVWLVPVYLYQRAKATKQNLAYFIVWLVCAALFIL